MALYKVPKSNSHVVAMNQRHRSLSCGYCYAESYHRVQLCGYSRLTRVRSDTGARFLKEYREIRELRSGINRVAESDVDLHRDTGTGKIGAELDPHAIVLVGFFDGCPLDR